MNLKSISPEEAKEKIQKECNEQVMGWMDNAKCMLVGC
jgi:hypothetical protein